MGQVRIPKGMIYHDLSSELLRIYLPRTRVNKMLTISTKRQNLSKRGEGEHHLGPHPRLPLSEEHHCHVLQGRCDGHRAGNPYRSIALHLQYSYDRIVAKLQTRKG